MKPKAKSSQYQGDATQPQTPALARYQQAYFAQWPECRSHLSWPGITYFVVQPHWVRYSDFDQHPPCIEEFSFEASRGVIKSAK